MDFKEYQESAQRTAKSNLTKDLKLANFGLGISGEAGEVTDYIKKVVFHGHELDKEKLKEELGDVLWYISTIAKVVDIDLEDVAIANIEKLKKRYPKGFSTQKSINREV